MTYIGAADYVYEIIIGQTVKPTRVIDVSGLPNGIFLAHVLACAAARQGVPVTGYRPDRFGQLNDVGSLPHWPTRSGPSARCGVLAGAVT